MDSYIKELPIMTHSAKPESTIKGIWYKSAEE
jgi:hypothetical protein